MFGIFGRRERSGSLSTDRKAERLPEFINVIDADGSLTAVNWLDVEQIELVTWAPISHQSSIAAIARLFEINYPRFFPELSFVGYPAMRYHDPKALHEWAAKNQEGIAELLDIAPHHSSIEDKKQAVERRYFPDSKHVLSPQNWNLLLEWCYVIMTTPIWMAVFNGEAFQKMPRDLRRVIFAVKPIEAMFILYQRWKSPFVAETTDQVFAFAANGVRMLSKNTDSQTWKQIEADYRTTMP